MDLPLEANVSDLSWSPRAKTNSILITGAAGTVARLITPKLAEKYHLVGIDTAPITDDNFAETYQADLADEVLLDRLAEDADFVLPLATGSSQGQDSLYAIELDATNRILASAIAHGTRRVLLASSNDAAASPELEPSPCHGDRHVTPAAPPRSDGLFGPANAYMKARRRFASDTSGLLVVARRT